VSEDRQGTKIIFCNDCKAPTKHVLCATHSRRRIEEEGEQPGEITTSIWSCAGCENETFEWKFTGIDDGEQDPTYLPPRKDEGVRTSIPEVESILPPPEIAGSYDIGDEYSFYRDLKTIVGFGTKELFIVDSYLDTLLFDIYMENVDRAITVRVLTDKVVEPLKAVAEKFSRRNAFELRSGKDGHDRVVFVDDRCWVIGQSIKDAAKKKPTYIVEHSSAASMKSIYESIWAIATPVVKGSWERPAKYIQ
jgi:hypothetical protein